MYESWSLESSLNSIMHIFGMRLDLVDKWKKISCGKKGSNIFLSLKKGTNREKYFISQIKLGK